jgi:hypothetical protein
MRDPARYTWLWYTDPGKFLPTWRQRLRFLVTVVALMFVSNGLGHAFLFEPFSAWYHDIQVRRLPKEQERYTRIIRIGPDDHRYIFGGRSPLLGDKIVQAVCAVARRGPSAVVVDLDTSSELDYPQGLALPHWPVPVIWGTDVGAFQSTQGKVTLGADPILGGRVEPLPDYGVAVMSADFDNVVRRWQRSELIGGYPRPTLAWAAVTGFCLDKNHDGRARCPDPRELEGAGESSVVSQSLWNRAKASSFTHDIKFLPIQISEFMSRDEAGGAKPRGFPTSCPATAYDERLRGRIVILGGSFSRADEHDTPWGKHQGAELVAMAIEHILRPEDRLGLSEYVLSALELVIALVIGVIHHWIRPIPATMFTLILLPVSVILAAECMLYFGRFQVGVVPFVVGMLIHQLAGSADRAEDLVKELEHAKHERTGACDAARQQ